MLDIRAFIKTEGYRDVSDNTYYLYINDFINSDDGLGAAVIFNEKENSFFLLTDHGEEKLTEQESQGILTACEILSHRVKREEMK